MPTRPDFGATLVSARSLAEYRALLDLPALEDLTRLRVLDCPGGAASFGAELAAAGGSVVAVDPVYRLDRHELDTHVHGEAVRGNRYVREYPEGFTWNWFADPADHQVRRLAAVSRFLDDRSAVPWRYVAAELPTLPFGDDAFDLALSSHLLFVYDDRLDLDTHVAACSELLRVAREVRVAPTASLAGGRSTLVEPVRQALRMAGCDVTTRRTSYRFQDGSDELVVVRR